MADAKVSALTAVTGAAAGTTDEFLINDGGVSKKITVAELVKLIELHGRQNNASVANQTLGTGDTYVTGSDCIIPDGNLQAKTMYRVRYNVTKTAAGVAAPVVTFRIGTAGTTADTSRAALTYSAQTGVIDEGAMEFYANFRTVGSGTTAVLAAFGLLNHRLVTTGLTVAGANEIKTNTGAGFDSTVSGLKIGISVNAGASSAWTLNVVQAECFNLA